MNCIKPNRFQDFFEENKYIFLKNYLYNYLLRKAAVKKSLDNEDLELVLEIGSGISPIIKPTNHIVYSDISTTALQLLKNKYDEGLYVLADGACLPFKSNIFSHAVCSEVLEHIRDDWGALKELARVLRPLGGLIVTFPHQKFYFTIDDRFVNHFRRYDLSDMENRMNAAGLKVINIEKVLGPLEKLTMCFFILCFSIFQNLMPKQKKTVTASRIFNLFLALFKWTNRLYKGLVCIDAKIMPRTFSTVLLVKAVVMKSSVQ